MSDPARLPMLHRPGFSAPSSGKEHVFFSEGVVSRKRLILATDLGGTHCRFGLFSGAGESLELLAEAWLYTAEIRNTDELAAACVRLAGVRLQEVAAWVIGMAGPVEGTLQGTLTNADLRIDLRDAEQRYGVGLCRVINDFTAEAWACLTPAASGARHLFPERDRVLRPAEGPGPIGVVGAGTGLGMALLVRDEDGRWSALASEGGHAAFPFTGTEEAAFAAFASESLGVPYLYGDDVLTGRGLCLLHRFLTGQELSASDVACRALSGPSETLTWYARFYGRVCRNWVLSTLCRGGLYVSGGIALRNPQVVRCPAFREEFYNTRRYRSLLESVPVFLAQGTNNGLWGCAEAACLLLARHERSKTPDTEKPFHDSYEVTSPARRKSGAELPHGIEHHV